MLKIKDDVDLKELEKFGFVYQEIKEPTHDFQFGSRKESYYTEKVYIYEDGRNTIEVLKKRNNSDWIHQNKEREVWIYESDYEMGVSQGAIEKLYDLIKADLVEKVEG